MSPLSVMMLLVLAVSILPGILVFFLVSLVDPQLAGYVGIFAWGFTFTSIIDWIVGSKLSEK